MKKYFFLNIFLLCYAFVFAFDMNIVDNLNQLKQELYLSDDSADFVPILENFKNINLNENLSEEEKFTIQAELSILKLNFVSDKRIQKETILDMLDYQKEMQLLIQNEKNLSLYFLTSYADMVSRIVGSVSGGDMYRLSMESKAVYQRVLRTNNKFAPAYSGYGNWLYFAPSVAGGGFNAALKQFNKAVKFALNDFDLYINYIYRSQVYFKLGNKKNCLIDLTKAHEIFPVEKLTEAIKEKNEKGNTFFD